MKKIITIVALMLVLTNIALAATTTTPTTTTPQNTAVSLQEIQIKELFIQENAKTQASIKQYIDKKTLEYEIYTKKEIEQNFMVLDNRINKFIRNAGIKLGAIFFSGIIFGGLILIFINRQLKKKTIVKRELIDQRFNERMNILEDHLRIIREREAAPYQKEIEEVTKSPTKKKKTNKKEEEIQPPTPPKETTVQPMDSTTFDELQETTIKEKELLERIRKLEEAQPKDPRQEAADKERRAKELEESIKAQYAELQKIKPKKEKKKGFFRRKKKEDKTKWSDA